MAEQSINIDRMEHAVALFGSFDENIKLIESEYQVKVLSRGNELKVAGDVEQVAKAVRVIDSLLTLLNRGELLSEQNVRYCMSLIDDGSEGKLESLVGDCICVTARGKPVKPKTLGQKGYCTAIKENTITIGVGPAGTGKTYLARCNGGHRFSGQGGQPDHFNPSRGGSGREAGFSARRPSAEGRPLPAPLVRRPV